MFLSKDGVSVDESKIQVIKKLKKLWNIAELRSFLGLATYLGNLYLILQIWLIHYKSF